MIKAFQRFIRRVRMKICTTYFRRRSISSTISGFIQSGSP